MVSFLFYHHDRTQKGKIKTLTVTSPLLFNISPFIKVERLGPKHFPKCPCPVVLNWGVIQTHDFVETHQKYNKVINLPKTLSTWRWLVPVSWYVLHDFPRVKVHTTLTPILRAFQVIEIHSCVLKIRLSLGSTVPLTVIDIKYSFIMNDIWIYCVTKRESHKNILF